MLTAKSLIRMKPTTRNSKRLFEKRLQEWRTTTKFFIALKRQFASWSRRVWKHKKAQTGGPHRESPQKISTDVAARIQREIDAGVTLRSEDPIDFTTFDELGEIIKGNWDVFGSLFSSRMRCFGCD